MILMGLLLFQVVAEKPALAPVGNSNTSWITVLTPILIIVGGILREYLSELRSRRIADAAAKIGTEQSGKLKEIHVLVNNQMSQALQEIAQLKSKWATEHPTDLLAQAQAVVSQATSDARPILATTAPPPNEEEKKALEGKKP